MAKKWMKDGAEFKAPLVVEGLAHYHPTAEELKRAGYVLTEVAVKPVLRQVTLADYDRAVENYLRRVRSERGYTDREPTAYINSGNKRWKQDAEDWIKFFDKVMEYALGVQQEVAKGKQPPSLADFRKGMPTMKWTME